MVNNVNIGDYVDYKSTPNSYTSLVDYNGYSNQTFTSNESTKWQVLSKDGNNICLISEQSIKTDNNTELSFSGKTGYLNGVKELNNICNIYGKGYGALTARSLSADDIIKLICTSGVTTPDIIDTSVFPSGIDFFDNSGNPTTKIYRNYSNYYDSYKTMNTTSLEYQLIFLSNNKYEENHSISWLATQAQNINETGCWYSLFEAYYFPNTSFHYCINGHHLYAANLETITRSSQIRPIVILRADLKAAGQDEMGTWLIQ